ncbi:Uma2 family endonuclease [Streptomyces sp. NPDC054956]
MIIPEGDRPRSKLSRFEDMFPGHRTELIGGAIVATPLRPTDNSTVQALWTQLKDQLSDDWGYLSDVAVPFDGDNEFCPDLAVVPGVEADKNLSAYQPDLVELVIEVVSPSSVRNDYEVKDRAYARRGIPHYLIFDPYKAQCTTLWNPGPDGYRGRDVFPYGEKVTLETGIGEVSLDTSALPVDPGAA